MLWSNLFARSPELTVSEVKAYLADANEEFQLVDVRQEKEYRSGHLPGALLIPLDQLERRFDELDSSLKTIVYCRSGVRSGSACQLLEQRGFQNIFNMKGGILAWQGQRVVGGEEEGLGYFLNGEYTSVYELSCNLEVGLQRFYELVGKQAADKGRERVAAFLKKMAEFEDEHIAELTALHNKEYPQASLQLDAKFVEGGLSLDNLLTAFGSNLDSAESVLQLAMSFEAQAMDLYFRLEKRAVDETQRQFFARMIKEERGHLRLLASMLEGMAV